ncbi:hypothetical protein LSH36_1293g00030 [Paralvinella palmiformis]|uniref:Ammonium transporter AmtB-like domain-containing protein n=1 Tax=Paralvinella palmiformis TaxID=53620 RepID=A0AAD9ITC0_9ANNE|nr:hypothetical protein LSH36_1293g00030 [Paralvinella palmiformis]
MGGSMFIHVFGAYFGIVCARVLYTNKTQEASHKETSVYNSDLFAMIGTTFIWIYWPSFNAALAPRGANQHRTVINTYYALTSCTVTSFAISSLVDENGRFHMVHIQNSTLAGAVAVGTLVNMMIQPWGALLVGFMASIVSVLGYRYITPALARARFHDSCGINNLHGMPGLIGSIGGIVATYLATEADYGYSLYEIFPARAPELNSTRYSDMIKVLRVEPGLDRTALSQAAWQGAALGTTLVIAIFGGIVVGLILRLPFLNPPRKDQLFDDTDYWILPEEGFPGSVSVDLSNAQLNNTIISKL